APHGPPPAAIGRSRRRPLRAFAGPSKTIGRSSKLTTLLADDLYFPIMDTAPTSGTPNDTDREARTRIADAIVTAAERGRTLTLEDLEAAGQPIEALGSDRPAQA